MLRFTSIKTLRGIKMSSENCHVSFNESGSYHPAVIGDIGSNGNEYWGVVSMVGWTGDGVGRPMIAVDGSRSISV